MDTMPFRFIVLFVSFSLIYTKNVRAYTDVEFNEFYAQFTQYGHFYLLYCIMDYESSHGFFFSFLETIQIDFFVCCPALAYQIKYIVMNFYSAELLTCQWQANLSNFLLHVNCPANIKFLLTLKMFYILCTNCFRKSKYP